MPTYKAPLDDMRFALNEVLEVAKLSSIPEFASVDTATVNEFLGEISKLAEEVLAPLNITGDREGCVYDLATKSVKTPKGFKDAYEQFRAAGLTGFSCDPDFGGMGMPQVLNTALSEMFCSANISFAMYPGLSHGAYHALHEYGSDELKNTYLPKIVSGEWSGTMCLTEPQCGTDLGLIKTKAVVQNDGTYAITGTKIFISAGEHDLTSNICHLVLARIDDHLTPAGIKGISLFLVPKFLQDGTRNGVACARIEEKMGIHGNSTCEMGFDNAKGWLIGEAHKGMRAMFVMMNEARLGVALQGLGLSEVAYQNAVNYAIDRKQGQPIEAKEAGAAAVSIITHPDVRRELMTVRATTEGGRMLLYWVAHQLDLSQKHRDAGVRAKAKELVDLLTPVLKAHLTDHAVDNTNAAMQVYGGHGYIKEHGMEQFNRDARISRIYEGANGIQGLDLIGRKVLIQNLLPAYIDVLKADIAAARRAGVPCELIAPVKAAARLLWRITLRLRMRALWGRFRNNLAPVMQDAGGIATDYLKLLGLVSLGHMWIKMAATAQGKKGDFYDAKLATAQFYMTKLMPQAAALARTISSGAKPLLALTPAQFAHDRTTVGEG